MYRLKEEPHIKAIDYLQTPLQTFKSALRQQTDGVAVRAAIFRMIKDEPQLLLVQRAESDSLPGQWELPGGGVDDGDASLMAALYREIKEETGLTGSWVIQEVGHGARWSKMKEGQQKHYLSVTFVVEIEEITMLERGVKVLKGGKEVDSEINITLAETEHQAYKWVTAEELEAQHLKVTGNTQVVMFQAFAVQQQVVMAGKKMDAAA